MRNDSLRLQDILDAIAAIQRHAPPSRDEFDRSETIRSHILLHVQIIGETASKLSEQLKAENPQVPWKSITRIQNIIAHVYFGIDWSEVWQVALKDILELRAQIETILGSGPAESAS